MTGALVRRSVVLGEVPPAQDSLKQVPHGQRQAEVQTMGYRHYVARATAFGDCYGGVEEWSTGCFFGIADADIPDPTQAAADAYLAAWETFFSNPTTSITNKYRLVGVRFAKLSKDDGKVIPAYNFYAHPTVPLAGGGGSGSPQPQLSVVLSLQARPDAGLGAKGRMYLPGVDHTIGSNGMMTAGDTLAIVNNAATMFNGLNDHADVPGRLINASQGRNLGLLNDMPVNRYVQDLLVGTAFDTQRRRRNQLQETYSTAEIFLD